MEPAQGLEVRMQELAIEAVEHQKRWNPWGLQLTLTLGEQRKKP